MKVAMGVGKAISKAPPPIYLRSISGRDPFRFVVFSFFVLTFGHQLGFGAFPGFRPEAFRFPFFRFHSFLFVFTI